MTLYRRTTISSADFLTCGSNPVQLVPSPGPGRMLVPVAGLLRPLVHQGSAGYDGIGTLVVTWGDRDEEAAGTFEGGWGYYLTIQQLTLATGEHATGGVLHRPLTLATDDGADPTGGDFPLVVDLWYLVAPIVTG